MNTAAFDPERATGTLVFAHGTRLTPAIKGILGALAFDAAGADPSSQFLSFSGESSATWGSVLEHLTSQGLALGITAPARPDTTPRPIDWLCAIAEYAGASPAAVRSVIGNDKLSLDDRASVEDLVALAKLVDDGHGLHGYRIEEYSVNVSDGQCALWNPFDWNFPSQAAAEQAAEDFLRENEESTVAVIGKVVIVNNEFDTEDVDDNLATIRRAYLHDLPAAPTM
jgi:hypothetical protein